MSYDLQRIVVTFVPSVDPCSRLPLSNLTSSVAPDGSSICLFQLHQQTNTAYSIFHPSSPKTLGLMSCSHFTTPFLCCAAGNDTHGVCMCACVHTFASTVSENITMQQHNQCVLAFLLHPSISISHRFTHLRALSPRAKPGWTFE